MFEGDCVADSEHHWHSIFQGAALDPQRWPEVLRTLADATGSTHGQLVGIGSARTVPFNWVTDFSDGALAEFVAIDGGSPAVNFRIAADIDTQPGAVIHERDYARARAALRNDAYLDFCEDHRIPYGCHMALTTADKGLIGLASLRGRGEGHTTERQRAEFARAAEAARAAVQLQLAIEHRGAAMLTGALEAMMIDCFMLDRDGRVGAMTPEAERRIAEMGDLRIEDGQLSSPVPAVARNIAQGLRAVFEGVPRTTIRLGDIFGPSLELFRIDPREWSLSFQPHVVAVVRDMTQRLHSARQTMIATYGFSNAEADVALMLCRGATRDDITVRRNVSVLTLRTQIKNIYAKTGVGREAELLALLYQTVF